MMADYPHDSGRSQRSSRAFLSISYFPLRVGINRFLFSLLRVFRYMEDEGGRHGLLQELSGRLWKMFSGKAIGARSKCRDSPNNSLKQWVTGFVMSRCMTASS